VFTKASLVAGRQAPLRRAYLEDPQRAVSVKWAATKAGAGADAFHSVVEIGTLAIDRSVKVGFRSMTCLVHLRVPQTTEQTRLAALRKHSQASCVNLDTLRSGVPIAVDFAVEVADERSSSWSPGA
jgi:hypothetical protein